MQSRACSETGQPSASASRKISIHSEGRFPALSASAKRMPSPAISKWRPTRVDAGAFRGRPGRALHAAELAGDGAGVLEVVAHQRLDALPRAVALAADGVGDALLELVGQHVGVAAGLGVQDAADLQQEILGVAEGAGGAGAIAVGALAAERLQVAHRGRCRAVRPARS